MSNPIAYQDHAVDVLAQVATYVGTGRLFALIASVEIKGGSARDVGSLAVVSDAGEMTGYMSNGCIDQDILFHAMDCLQSGIARLLQYGEGSPFHDLTLPCGGALSVWIDPKPDKDALVAAYRSLLARQPPKHRRLPISISRDGRSGASLSTSKPVTGTASTLSL